jgi:hypothetical protein
MIGLPAVVATSQWYDGTIGNLINLYHIDEASPLYVADCLANKHIC